MNRFRWLVVCAAMGISLAAGAQKIELKVNYEPGTYVMKQDMTMDMSIDVDGQTIKARTVMALTAEMIVGKAGKDGSRETKLTFRHIKNEVSQDGNTVMEYDSSDKKAQDPVARLYGAMIDRTITMTIDSQGAASNISGFDEVIDAMLEGGELVGMPKEKLKKDFGSTFLESFSQMKTFPDKPVGKGDSWEISTDLAIPVLGDMQIKQVCTLKDVKDGVATVTIKGSMKAGGSEGADENAEEDGGMPGLREMNMTMDGTMLMNVATGLAKSMTMTQKGTFVMSVNGMEMKTTMDGGHKITISKGTYKASAAAK